MDIHTAEFVKSAPDHTSGPTDGRNEYAFIGRSNVGKSSLINMLTGIKGLAKTSQRPGKTLLINYFLVDSSYYIVDLPGYGYAKIPPKERAKIQRMINGYIGERLQMATLFVLIDVRHSPLAIDLDFIRRLGEAEIPFAIVFTKADKLSTSQVETNVTAYKKELSKSWEELPPIFVTSSQKGTGRDELLAYLSRIESI